MNSRVLSVVLSSVLLLSIFVAHEIRAEQGAPKTASTMNWKAVDDAMGRAAQDQPDGVHKFSMPRGDLKVMLDGIELKPGFALGSWAGFANMGSQTEVMGGLVLLEAEVGPVMQKLIE